MTDSEPADVRLRHDVATVEAWKGDCDDMILRLFDFTSAKADITKTSEGFTELVEKVREMALAIMREEYGERQMVRNVSFCPGADHLDRSGSRKQVKACAEAARKVAGHCDLFAGPETYSRTQFRDYREDLAAGLVQLGEILAKLREVLQGAVASFNLRSGR